MSCSLTSDAESAADGLTRWTPSSKKARHGFVTVARDNCGNIASLTMPALSSTFFHFFFTLLHPLRDERHFALVEISAIPQVKPCPDCPPVWSRFRNMVVNPRE